MSNFDQRGTDTRRGTHVSGLIPTGFFGKESGNNFRGRILKTSLEN